MSYVSMITLGVTDLDRATRFYEAVGWQRSPASVTGTVAFLVGDGPVVLGLFGRDDLATEAGVPPAAGPGRSVALAANQPSREAVDRFVELVAAAGGTVTAAPTATEWGGYGGYVTDPDGHLWEVAHNDGFPLAEDGTITVPRPI